MSHWSPFEIIMLLCFGASWPFAVYKTWTTKLTAGKSPVFLWLVIIGYLSGMVHKFLHSYDWVVALYLLNTLMVAVDLVLYYRYRKNPHT